MSHSQRHLRSTELLCFRLFHPSSLWWSLAFWFTSPTSFRAKPLHWKLKFAIIMFFQRSMSSRKCDIPKEELRPWPFSLSRCSISLTPGEITFVTAFSPKDALSLKHCTGQFILCLSSTLQPIHSYTPFSKRISGRLFSDEPLTTTAKGVCSTFMTDPHGQYGGTFP